MIEAHYGALLDTAHESLLERLEASVAASESTSTKAHRAREGFDA